MLISVLYASTTLPIEWEDACCSDCGLFIEQYTNVVVS